MKPTCETRNSLKTWLEAAASFFYPELCCVCGNEHATPDKGYVCANCREQVRYIKPPFCSCCGMPFPGDITSDFTCSNCLDLDFHFSKARAVIAADDMGLQLVHRYKYNRQIWLETFFKEALASHAAPELQAEAWDLLVPVPLHPVREAEREFNQALRLARLLSEATGIPMAPKALIRTKLTSTQTALNRHDRAKNMKGAFSIHQRNSVIGKRVVLIDDVFTTGATTNACAKVISNSGAQDICVWTLARGLGKN